MKIATPLVSCSDRFCALKFHNSCGSIVYMPSAAYSATDYLNTLCELVESFIGSNPCDGVCIAGDINVDFGRGGSHVNNLLDDFVLELDLVVCDLSVASSVNYTY